MASIRISSVTFEHHPTGFGIGHARPRISWRFVTTDETENWLQEAYEVQIGRPNGLVANTYRVQSSESVLLPWPDHALQSRESAWVKIRSHGKATDKAGTVTTKSTEWSSPATVEVALLERRDWAAKLTASTSQPKRKSQYRLYYSGSYLLYLSN